MIVLLSAIAVFFTGCRPRGILHSWEMREVLVDMHKTDAMLQLAIHVLCNRSIFMAKIGRIQEIWA